MLLQVLYGHRYCMYIFAGFTWTSLHLLPGHDYIYYLDIISGITWTSLQVLFGHLCRFIIMGIILVYCLDYLHMITDNMCTPLFVLAGNLYRQY